MFLALVGTTAGLAPKLALFQTNRMITITWKIGNTVAHFLHILIFAKSENEYYDGNTKMVTKFQKNLRNSIFYSEIFR